VIALWVYNFLFGFDKAAEKAKVDALAAQGKKPPVTTMIYYWLESLNPFNILQ
jgi:hypothetical protein